MKTENTFLNRRNRDRNHRFIVPIPSLTFATQEGCYWNLWSNCHLLKSPASLSSDIQADTKRTECPNEQIALECPILESVVQNKTLLELQWRATDPEDLKKESVVYCNKNLQCTRYRNIGSFDQRIKVSNPVRGTLLVKQMEWNDHLIYTCVIERSGNKGPIANKIIVTSSKHCK